MNQLITFEDAYELSRKYISKYHTSEGTTEKEIKAESSLLIDKFIDELNISVLGYGTDIEKLKKDLKDEIIEYKAITDLMSDDTVTEITIESYKSIAYVKDGQTCVWNKPFKNNLDLEKVLNKLIGEGKRLTRETPHIISTTFEGYHIEAKHESLTGNYHTALIRK